MIRTLVLSGGGGRGAFHAGVYKYLAQAPKDDLDVEHRGAWLPDVVVGTSIGAVNGAAIAQGISAEQLEAFWLSLRENDIQGLPPGMGGLARCVANYFLKRSLGASLRRIPPHEAMSPSADEAWPPIPILPQWLAERWIGRWSNFLDTAPLYHILQTRLGLDEAKLAQSPTTLLINATKVRSGEGVVFSNRQIDLGSTRTGKVKALHGVTIRRIIASCSIPLVYPWTKDEDGEIYWDGALVANTPLGAAFDAVRGRPMEEDMEIVVVLLNPWVEDEKGAKSQRLPSDFIEAATWALDWTMLASFRVSFKMLKAFNALCDSERAMGLPQSYRRVRVVMVAPPEFLPVTRIIDYDELASRQLITQGYACAEGAFQAAFGKGGA
jgi:NTE family protein